MRSKRLSLSPPLVFELPQLLWAGLTLTGRNSTPKSPQISSLPLWNHSPRPGLLKAPLHAQVPPGVISPTVFILKPLDALVPGDYGQDIFTFKFYLSSLTNDKISAFPNPPVGWKHIQKFLLGPSTLPLSSSWKQQLNFLNPARNHILKQGNRKDDGTQFPHEEQSCEPLEG